jgi:hypothetical protein
VSFCSIPFLPHCIVLGLNGYSDPSTDSVDKSRVNRGKGKDDGKISGKHKDKRIKILKILINT